MNSTIQNFVFFLLPCVLVDTIKFASNHFGYIVALSVAVGFDLFHTTTHFATNVKLTNPSYNIPVSHIYL